MQSEAMCLLMSWGKSISEMCGGDKHRQANHRLFPWGLLAIHCKYNKLTLTASEKLSKM